MIEARSLSKSYGDTLVLDNRVGFASAVRSEFTKIRSVRSTYWTLLVMIIVCVGMGVLFSAGRQPRSPARRPRQSGLRRWPRPRQAVTNSLIGLLIGQLVIAVLGALTITSEYSTGMIRTSLTSMPRRGTIYSAKALSSVRSPSSLAWSPASRRSSPARRCSPACTRA